MPVLPIPRRAIFFLSLFLLGPGSPIRADDWPRWRGPRGDGIWREDGILRKFPSGGPRFIWRVPIGPGYTGPSVAEGRVYCMDRDSKAETERVTCHEFETGKLVWSHTYPAPYSGVDYKAGPRATPTFCEGRLYTLGTMGHLLCLEASTGKVLWKKDLAPEYGARIPTWGIAAAPLVEGRLLAVNCGGSPAACVVAFDRETGAEAWKAIEDAPAYSPPAVTEAGGRRQLIQWTGRHVFSLDPATGKELWRIPFKSRFDLAIIAPVHYRDHLFVSSFYGGALLLDLDPVKPAARVRWQSEPADERQTKIIHCLMSNPWFSGDHFYGVDSYGQLRCIEIATGKRLWETFAATGNARWSNAHIIPNGDAAFLWNEHGELIIARLSPEGYTELAREKLLEPTVGSEGLRAVTWAHPAFAARRVVVRNDLEMVCADLSVGEEAGTK